MKIKYKLLYLFFIQAALIFITSCGLIKQGVELKTFSSCNFSLQKVNVISVAGVNVEEANKLGDLSMNDYLLLAKKAFGKELPSQLKITVKTYNPNDKRAYINGLDWELYLKGDLYSEGTISNPVEVLPQQKTTFDVISTLNLFEIIHSKSLSELLQVIFTKNKSINLSDLDAKLKIKPWYNTGSSIKKFPTFININL